MATAVANKRENAKSESAQAVQEFREARLPYHPVVESRFGIDKSSWKALVEAIFPNATSTDSVILALSYCRARNLDVFKRCVHIVPIWSSAQKCLVDSIWPGIGELRTTAFRTGEYAGKDRTLFGDDISQKVGNADMTFPEWAEVTVYRLVKGQRVAFVGPKVYWLETYAEAKRGELTPNEMWRDRPRGQLDKCAEAAALRTAFPEECGGEYIPEEAERTGTAVTVQGTSSNALESVTKQLTHEQQTTPPQETPQPTKQPTLDESFAAYQAELLSAPDVLTAQAVYDKWFNPDATVDWTDEHRFKADGMRAAHQDQVRKDRGQKTQKELVNQ